MNARAILGRFIAYGGVGLAGTAAHYLLLFVLVEAFHVAAYAGAGAGYVLGGLINYSLNHRITFRSNRRHRVALPRFFVVAAIGVVLTAAVVAWATQRLQLHYFIAQVAATALLLLLTFALNSRWTFRGD